MRAPVRSAGTIYRTGRSTVHVRVLGRSYHSEGAAFAPDELNDLQARVQKFRGKLHLPRNAATTELLSQPRTIVLAFGWAQSNLKAMAKYAPLYTDLGLPYLCVAPSVVHVWSTKLGSSITSGILNALESSLSTEPCSLVLHLFSAGGTVFFPKACEEYEKPSSLFYRKVKPVCAIFDSGPAEFSYEAGTAGAKLVYMQGGFNYATYRVARTLGILSEKAFGKRKRAELQHALNNSGLLDLAQLYLYSEVDTVCLSSRVKALIAEQTEKGREVSSHCWPDTEHVRHFLSRPEEYREQVEGFLRKCSVVQ